MLPFRHLIGVVFHVCMLVADPKDRGGANMRTMWCLDADCVNSAVFQLKFGRQRKGTISLGSLDFR